MFYNQQIHFVAFASYFLTLKRDIEEYFKINSLELRNKMFM